MEKKRMEKLNIEPSLLGFGCMRFPVNEDNSINEVEAKKLLDRAIEGGVTYIDTAYPYHDGKSEEFVGRALEEYKRDSYFLATKLPVWKIEKTEDVRTIFEEQLKNLRTDYVDFYLLHALDNDKWNKVLDLKMIEECEKLRSEGKIKYLGFSFHDELDVFKKIVNYRPWDFCQLQLNYVDANIQQGMEGYRICEELGIPVIIMEPVKGGALAKLPESMEKIFKDIHKDKSVASWSFRHLGTMPNVKVILSGMTQMNQLEDNLDTFNNFKPLDEKEQKAIEEVTKEYRKRQQNRCTTCGYCMPCPFGVKIPLNFKIWNTAYIYEDVEGAKPKYEAIGDGKAINCQKCGACLPKCPQGINIIEDLERVSEIFEK